MKVPAGSYRRKERVFSRPGSVETWSTCGRFFLSPRPPTNSPGLPSGPRGRAVHTPRPERVRSGAPPTRLPYRTKKRPVSLPRCRRAQEDFKGVFLPPSTVDGKGRNQRKRYLKSKPFVKELKGPSRGLCVPPVSECY